MLTFTVTQVAWTWLGEKRMCRFAENTRTTQGRKEELGWQRWGFYRVREGQEM